LSSKAKGKEKEEKASSKKIVKKENHFAMKGDIQRALLLKQSFNLLLSRENSRSTTIPLELEVIPQVKELLDEGLVRKSINPCALLVPKIGIMRYQIPMIGGIMNVLSGATLFCKITHASNIFMIHIHRCCYLPFECAQYDFKIMYFSFLCFLIFGVDKGVVLAPTYPQVR